MQIYNITEEKNRGPPSNEADKMASFLTNPDENLNPHKLKAHPPRTTPPMKEEGDL